ncbi:MAG: DinB family protein [Candidatus Ranarchaeia archaeon]|jgi:hypothetical protein
MSNIELPQLYGSFYHSHEIWIRKATNTLTKEELSWIPPGGANTIRWILQHVTRYLFYLIRSSLGGDREIQFEPKDGEDASLESVVSHLRSTFDEVVTQLTALTTQDLLEERVERSGKKSPLGEHFRKYLDHNIAHLGQVTLLRAMYKRMHQ